MQELVAQIAEKLGIDADIAGKAIGIILKMLKENGDAEKLAPIMAALDGADDMIAGAPSDDAGAGSGLMSTMGSLMGGNSIMQAVGQLQGLGLDIPQSQSIAKDLITYSREKAGEDVVNDALKDIPGIDMVL